MRNEDTLRSPFLSRRCGQTPCTYGAILVMHFFALKSETGLSHIVIATFVGVDAQTVLKALYQRYEGTWYRAILDCDHAGDIIGSWVV
jgi:hypothetical protein